MGALKISIFSVTHLLWGRGTGIHICAEFAGVGNAACLVDKGTLRVLSFEKRHVRAVARKDTLYFMFGTIAQFSS